MTGANRRNGARELRALRQARGWSWSDLARALRETARRLGVATVAETSLATIQRSVARWENETRSVRPGERYQLLLAHLYAGRDGSTALGPGSDFARLTEALADLGVQPERLAELRDLVTDSATTDGSLLAFLSPRLRDDLGKTLADPRKLDRELIARLSTVVDDVNGRVGAVPFVRLQVGLVPLVQACRSLLRGQAPAALKTPLLTVAVNAYSLAARLAFETNDDATSKAFYAEAIATADKLPDPWHRAAVRTGQTMVTLYATGDLGVAQRTAEDAVRDAHQGSSLVIRARAHALKAEMNARGQSARNAFTALHHASYAIQGDTTGDPAGDSFNAGRLHGFEGVCHLHAGDPAEAERQLSDSIRSLDRPRDAVQRSIVLTDLAVARIRQHAPDSAAEVLHRCIDLTASTRGRVPAQRIRQARLELSPWRNEPFVADVDEHIHMTLIAP